jgi:hypothetical protein
MAGAFIPSIEVETSQENLILKLRIIFFGTGLRDLSEVEVSILPSETLSQIKTKLVDAIISEANSLGYSLSASNIILPTFQKGA